MSEGTRSDRRRVADVLPEFADAFPFERFNPMQSAALDAVLGGDDNVVVCAPTASGKTAVAELAICDTLRRGGTALFVAPLRALTSEREREWQRFEELGYSVYVVSGERELNPRRAERADVLVTTPEKADSATRNHDSARYSFVTDVDCVVVDEVHLLDSEKRGSVLEAVVSRLRRLCAPRVVALSATMQNVEDVADWLDAPPETTFDFGEDHRPVDLTASVATYRHGENTFADKYRRLYRAFDLVEEHLRADGQALVFVASRQDTVRAAGKARDELAERDVPVGARHDYDLHTAAQELENDDLRHAVVDGVAFHHAGLSKDDRERVESWFRDGSVDVLFSTSTLAWGVNLPARCVVIRDTKRHDPLEGAVEVSPIDVLQMLGRAGRPGYDDEGYGWVVCDESDAGRYRRLLDEGVRIESRLADDLDAHLNAEVATGTVDDLDDALSWLDTTFYAVRARADPERYSDDLRGRARETVERLVEGGFVTFDDDLRVEATALGRLASKYYLRLDTARAFRAAADRDRLTDDDLLRTVARAAEFDSVSVRADERDAVETVVGDEAEGGAAKVLAVLRSGAAGSTPEALRSDAWVIRQNATRLLSALRAVLAEFAGPRAANLARRVEARVDNGVSGDAVGLTAVDGVGAGRARTLAGAGHRTPGDLVRAGADELERAGLAAGVAERVVEAAADLPDPRIDLDLPDAVARGESEMRELRVENAGGGGRLGVRVTVEGREMSTAEPYLRAGESTTLPVGVFGAADAGELTFRVAVHAPDLPLPPVVSETTVRVD